MPTRAARICSCGRRVASGERCPCQVQRDRERKARHDANRPSARQRGYTATWDQTRREFLRVHPNCKRCSSPASVVDHVVPHRGDMRLFWDRANWQSLCVPCHSRAKQAEEKRA
ncbi:MAG: HNH endonuclease [Hyphomicrobiaceae bacterium]